MDGIMMLLLWQCNASALYTHHQCVGWARPKLNAASWTPVINPPFIKSVTLRSLETIWEMLIEL